MSKVGILTLPGANVHAVSYWVKRSGAEALMISCPEQVSGTDCLLLPGVGAFDPAMSYIERKGFRQAIRDYAQQGGYLAGICLGMQIMFEHSEEGRSTGLGLVPGCVRRISSGADRVPNIGWRHVSRGGQAYFQRAPVFFMHSYGIPTREFSSADACLMMETVECNGSLVAAFRLRNLVGFQYHPEKSYAAGDRLLSEMLNEI